MKRRIIGRVGRINGPLIEAVDIFDAVMMELVRVGDRGLIGEIVKLEKKKATVQVYEDTTGLKPGAPVYGAGMPLSVELGPGLIGQIYDGIQRPLAVLKEKSGSFLERGIRVSALREEKKWDFLPSVSVGDAVSSGSLLGTVRETSSLEHRISVPPGIEGEVKQVVPEGSYDIRETIVLLKTPEGEKELRMSHPWPIRHPRPLKNRLPLSLPLITGQRVIDTLFPLAKGGTVAIPGGFGTGKTMTQHAVAKWCDADVIVYIGCGERGNEMTDVLKEFPELIDPRTERSIMERTILIANTSNMPVSAREASIYTGVTLAEYYRDMGYHVAVMADSTSRWAEALRELSGRMEEMPAEEGFPAYLSSRIADFYERAGYGTTLSGRKGSVSLIGAVSPPGGDFSEPVTQHTKRFVRCFWGLDRQLAHARHYPAISWINSYSEYTEELHPWWKDRVGSRWVEDRKEILELLQKEVKLRQIVKLVGPDALPESQQFILDVCRLFKDSFLQQNAFDLIDRYSAVKKQSAMLSLVLLYWREGNKAVQNGTALLELRRMPVLQDLIRMKSKIPNDDEKAFEKLALRLEQSFIRLTGSP